VSREYRQFHRGTLLIATTQDGNGHVLPLAFSVVEEETLTAWSWFLAHLREHITDKDDICLIYDCHASSQSLLMKHLGGNLPMLIMFTVCDISQAISTRSSRMRNKNKC